MRSESCALRGGSRLPTRGGVASTPEYSEGGRAKPGGPCHFCEMKATRRGTKASRGSERRHRDVDGRDGSKKKFCDPHNQAELAKCRLEAPLLDRYGSTAGATVDTGSLQQDLWLEAVRPRAAPPSLSLKVVKFRPQTNKNGRRARLLAGWPGEPRGRRTAADRGGRRCWW